MSGLGPKPNIYKFTEGNVEISSMESAMNKSGKC